MPKQPSSARRFTYSSGICASRSMTLPSTVSRNSRSLARKSRVFAASSSEGSGKGGMRSSGKRPRNNSLASEGLSHPLSRDSSATARACSSLTCACCAIGHLSLGPTPWGASVRVFPAARRDTRDYARSGVQFASDSLDDFGNPACDLFVRVAALAQLGLYGALQQGDHVLDHAVQLIGVVLVLGGTLSARTAGQCGRWVDQLHAQCLRSAPSGRQAEFHALPRLEAFNASGQRRGTDVDVLAVLLR